MTLLGNLTNGFMLKLGCIPLMAPGTPPADSILASEVSTVLGLVSNGHRIT